MNKLIVYHLSQSEWGGVLTAERTGFCCGFQGCLYEHPCYIYKASVQDNGDSI